MSTAPPAQTSWLANRRTAGIGIAIVLALALAAAVGISSFWRPQGENGNAVQNALNAGASGVGNALSSAAKSVADLFAGRSPGERAEGTLANLKHRRLAGLHERALPKVRRPGAASPLAGIVGATPVVPPAEVLPPPAAPLYNVVAGGPGAPVAAPPPGGGPVIFPAIPPPPGGGGGVIFPPPVTPPPVTPPPVTPPITPPVVIPPPPTGSVPEPSTWAMMLLGFAMIGRAVRGRGRLLGQPAIG